MNLKRTKSESIFLELRQAILRGHILPGEWLRQDELAAQFEASSTPVREALKRLEAEGLVEHVAYQGARVVAYSLNEVQDYFDLRVLVEGYAAQLAAARMTAEQLAELASVIQAARDALAQDDLVRLSELNWAFHEKLILLCGSKLVQDTLTIVWRGFQFDNLLMIPERGHTTIQEHQEVLDTLVAGDGERAAALMRAHIEKAREAILTRPVALSFQPY